MTFTKLAPPIMALLLFLSVYFINTRLQTSPDHSDQVLASTDQQEQTGPEFPSRLLIPKLDIDASVEFVGLTPKGDMAVPKDIKNVGWFDSGPRPGERGSAVIAGHFSGDNTQTGVFNNLHSLEVGDQLYILDTNGTSTTFIVREKRSYDPGHVEEVFGQNDLAHLNLITCGGEWDKTKKSYTKRLVIFTDIVH